MYNVYNVICVCVLCFMYYVCYVLCGLCLRCNPYNMCIDILESNILSYIQISNNVYHNHSHKYYIPRKWPKNAAFKVSSAGGVLRMSFSGKGCAQNSTADIPPSTLN